MARKPAAEAPFDFSKSLQKLTPESFFQFVRQYPNNEGTQVYVYRLTPVIDRGQAGIDTSYIDTQIGSAGSQLDEEYLLRTHGSGRYHLKFSDSNKPKGLTEVAKATVDLWDPRVDPIVDPAELVVSAPGNQKFIQPYLAKGWTVQEGKLTPPASGESAAGKLADTVRDLAGQVAAKPAQPETNNEMLRLVRELVQDRHQVDPTDRAFQIAERLRPQADPMQVELLRTMGQLLMERARPAEPAVNPISQLKETAALLKEFGWGAGEGGGSWIQLFQALPGILQYGAAMFREMRMMRALEQQQPAAVRPIGSPAPVEHPAAPGTIVTPADGLEEPKQEEEPLPNIRGLPFSLKDLQRMKQAGENALDAFERGIDGDDFAHALVCGSRDGEALYSALFDMGKEGVLALIGMIPGLAEKLEPKRAELEAWLDQFISYGTPEEKPKPGDKAA